ncbi:unnamed protein product [Calypogeia fissa]
MLEVHRWRQIDWRPSAVVALATSVNGTVVAAARENGAIELWNVAPGSVGWHCLLTIPGKEDAAISSLVWCKSWDEEVSPLGRLFSAGLDGFITEWDLQTLQPKEIVESYGGSVWQLAAEPLVKPVQSSKIGNGSVRMQNGALDDDSDESSDEEDSDNEDDKHVEQKAAEQRVVVGCDDGCLRLFTVSDSDEGMLYRRSFPRVEGRILSVAWSVDGSKIYSGGSDGCIHCWDSYKVQELFRITAGIGGLGGGAELCVWSLLVLRDGTIVSGDSSGSTQFWEGKHGTLIQALAKHGADVLALAVSPSHRGVYAAGADGQVVLYQHVDTILREDAAAVGSANTVGVLTDKWVCVGSKRTHTHDVRALAVAFPYLYEEGQTTEMKFEKRIRKRDHPGKSSDHRKWLQPGAPMLISGGNDSKLFTYPANAFLAFHPHDICPAPQHPHVQLTSEVGNGWGTMFMAQYSTWVDVWRTNSNSKNLLDMKEGLDFRKDVLGKRKAIEDGSNVKRKNMKPNGGLLVKSASDLPACNGMSESLGHERTQMAETKGISPELVARIKSKSAEHICCSAISSNGRYVAFSDRLKPRLYKLEPEKLGPQSSKKTRGVAKKNLPASIPAAQSIQFTHDNTRLLLGRPHQILVVDVEDAKVVHSFHVDAPVTSGEWTTGLSPLKLMCTSADSQWVAAITSSGHVHVFNLETMKHHWSTPVPDGSVATSAIFRRSSSNVLIISTSTNQIHVLNVEAKELSEWSAINGPQMSRCMLDFPGAIIGLSVPPKSTSTSVIAYSPRAMCKIDFSKSVSEITLDAREDETSGTSAEASPSSAQKDHVYASENGVGHRVNGHSHVNNNFAVVHFKNPVLFIGHTSLSSVLVVEKPWLDVLRKFPAPVFRHLYGT